MKSLKEFRSNINEVLKASDPIDKWISDFVHSKDPKFANKSKAERINMAKGAYYGSQKNENISVDEETPEQAKARKELDLKLSKWKNQQRAAKALGESDAEWEKSMEKQKHDRINDKDKDTLSKLRDLMAKEKKPAKEKTEEVNLDEKSDQAVQNKTMKNNMDTSRGAKWKAQNNMTGDAVRNWDGKHKTAQAQNKAIGRALRSEDAEELDELKASTLQSYSDKAHQQAMDATYDAAHLNRPGQEKDKANAKKLAGKRAGGVQRAMTKLDRIKEEKDEREYGYEGDMAMSQLKTICRHSEHLMGMLKPDTDLPEWVQSKITLATDYMQTAHDYLMSEMNESVEEEVEQIDELSKGTLSSYVKKAHKDNALTANDLGHQLAMSKKPGLSAGTDPTYTKGKNKYLKRSDNIDKAVSKLAKEEVELEESRAHKVIATFLKNREVAKRAYQGNPAKKDDDKNKLPMSKAAAVLGAEEVAKRAYQGNPAKDAEVAQGGGSPADQGIAAAKKDYKKLNKEGVYMLNFNDFLKEGKCGSMKKEELKGNQHKLDHNKNGKLDADDFKKLRGENKDCDYEKESFVSNAQRKAVWASKNEKGVKEEAELDETLTSQLVKQGIGIARDKRYAGNNMTGATKAMDKLHPKLQNHPRVAAELKKQNEEFNQDSEQLDELSKKTLGSYAQAAAFNAAQQGNEVAKAGNNISKLADPKGPLAKLNKRLGGHSKAIDKLTKEEYELEESTPISFSNFKTVLEAMKGRASDILADLKAKREANPNYAYTDHYAKSTSGAKNKDVNVNKVAGKAYGGAKQKDDEGDEKPDDNQDKRGRGRPSGSKSGARQKGNGHTGGGIPVHNLNLPKFNNKF